jgi:hypothetical protein
VRVISATDTAARAEALGGRVLVKRLPIGTEAWSPWSPIRRGRHSGYWSGPRPTASRVRNDIPSAAPVDARTDGSRVCGSCWLRGRRRLRWRSRGGLRRRFLRAIWVRVWWLGTRLRSRSAATRLRPRGRCPRCTTSRLSTSSAVAFHAVASVAFARPIVRYR